MTDIDNIGGIATAIVNEHNESIHHWQEAGLENATLLHVDAHSDMADNVAPLEDLGLSDPLDYYKALGITDFLSAAVDSGIVSSLYWLNPHSESRKLQDMGSKEENDGRPKLGTRYVGMRFGQGQQIRWDRDYNPSEGLIINPNDIELGQPFILDIDLDGFCCNKGTYNVSPSYDGVNNYESRVDQLISLLRGQRRPDIITISRSVTGDTSTFMPAGKVNDVQAYLVRKLSELYQTDN